MRLAHVALDHRTGLLAVYVALRHVGFLNTALDVTECDIRWGFARMRVLLDHHGVDVEQTQHGQALCITRGVGSPMRCRPQFELLTFRVHTSTQPSMPANAKPVLDRGGTQLAADYASIVSEVWTTVMAIKHENKEAARPVKFVAVVCRSEPDLVIEPAITPK